MENGSFPEDAFRAGSNPKKEKVLVARAAHENGTQPCQFHEGCNGAQMPYGGEGLIKSSYDILANSNALHWKSITVGQLPADSFKTGCEANGDALYTVKCKLSEKVSIGKYNGNDKAYFVVDGQEKEITSGEMKILCFRESDLEKSVSIKDF